jgi:hypothetical protein
MNEGGLIHAQDGLYPPSSAPLRQGLLQAQDSTDHASPARQNDDTLQHFPRHVGLILGNEFCERFSFYGLKAILAMFLPPPLPPPFAA